MLTYDEAVARILRDIAALPAAHLPLLSALGLVLSEDVIAPLALPPFASSAMDGYAVRFADAAHAAKDAPVFLPLAGTVAAGDLTLPVLTPGTALRIMTGAPLPSGADTVVPIEDASADAGHIQIHDAGSAGQFIRAAGGDMASGDLLMARGSMVRSLEIAAAAAAGQAALPVHPKPRVAIISTGSEIVEPGRALQRGQIYNANAYALAAQVEEAGGLVAHRLLAGDTPSALRDAFDACEGADMIVSSGGVSVGEFDYVKAVFAERGTVDFWRVAIRPGKPLAFGHWDRTLFFGLPGNPVSALVTFELFVRPALKQMLGAKALFRPCVTATLSQDVSHEPGRRSFLRGTVAQGGDEWTARLAGAQGSHQISALPQTNALLVMPENEETRKSGSQITAMLLGGSGEACFGCARHAPML